jgi:hypothetical protein
MINTIAISILVAVFVGGRIYPKQTAVIVIVAIAILLLSPFLREAASICR